MFGLFKKRIHEPIALAAIIAASVSFHIAWIVNLIFTRSSIFDSYLTLSDVVGPITGMYTVVGITYLITFGATVIWCRGKDCTDYRERVFWFFIVSLIVFLVLTHPLVYEFEITAPNG